MINISQGRGSSRAEVGGVSLEKGGQPVTEYEAMRSGQLQKAEEQLKQQKAIIKEQQEQKLKQELGLPLMASKQAVQQVLQQREQQRELQKKQELTQAIYTAARQAREQQKTSQTQSSILKGEFSKSSYPSQQTSMNLTPKFKEDTSKILVGEKSQGELKASGFYGKEKSYVESMQYPYVKKTFSSFDISPKEKMDIIKGLESGKPKQPTFGEKLEYKYFKEPMGEKKVIYGLESYGYKYAPDIAFGLGTGAVGSIVSKYKTAKGVFNVIGIGLGATYAETKAYQLIKSSPEERQKVIGGAALELGAFFGGAKIGSKAITGAEAVYTKVIEPKIIEYKYNAALKERLGNNPLIVRGKQFLSKEFREGLTGKELSPFLLVKPLKAVEYGGISISLFGKKIKAGKTTAKYGKPFLIKPEDIPKTEHYIIEAKVAEQGRVGDIYYGYEAGKTPDYYRWLEFEKTKQRGLTKPTGFFQREMQKRGLISTNQLETALGNLPEKRLGIFDIGKGFGKSMTYGTIKVRGIDLSKTREITPTKKSSFKKATSKSYENIYNTNQLEGMKNQLGFEYYDWNLNIGKITPREVTFNYMGEPIYKMSRIKILKGTFGKTYKDIVTGTEIFKPRLTESKIDINFRRGQKLKTHEIKEAYKKIRQTQPREYSDLIRNLVKFNRKFRKRFTLKEKLPETIKIKEAPRLKIIEGRLGEWEKRGFTSKEWDRLLRKRERPVSSDLINSLKEIKKGKELFKLPSEKFHPKTINLNEIEIIQKKPWIKKTEIFKPKIIKKTEIVKKQESFFNPIKTGRQQQVLVLKRVVVKPKQKFGELKQDWREAMSQSQNRFGVLGSLSKTSMSFVGSHKLGSVSEKVWAVGNRFSMLKSKVIVKPRIKEESILKEKEKVKSKEKGESIYLTKTKQESKQIQIQRTGSISILRSVQKQETTPISDAVSITMPIFDVTHDTISKQDLIYISKLKTKQDLVTDLDIPPIIPQPKKPEEPKPFGFVFKFGESQKDYEQPYNVFIRQKGNYNKINPKPLSREDAKSLGMKVTDDTTAASFQLRKAKGEIKEKLKQGLFTSSNKFYNPPSPRGRLPQKDTYVEKNQFRIDTPGELRGITAKGWMVNRQKGLFNEVKREVKETKRVIMEIPIISSNRNINRMRLI